MERGSAMQRPATGARTARRPSGGGRAGRLASATLRLVGRRPGAVLALVAVAGGGGLFGWNALMRQPSPHPAPLFASAKPAVPPVEPPRRPDFQAASTSSAAPARGEAAPARSGADAARPPSPPDAIGTLIRSGDPASRVAEPKSSAPPAPPAARVASAQKALAKLGYGPLETDGKFGSVTRQAIERFERDRNIPVTGSLGSKTARQLAAKSGILVE